MKINRSKWRKGYEGVWKQGEEEGNGFLLYLETLENDDTSSRSPTVLHRGTRRQHTIHLPLTTAVTPIGHMSASFSHVTPRPGGHSSWPDLLSLNVSARHRHVLGRDLDNAKSPAFPFIEEAPSDWRGCMSFIFSINKVLLPSVSPSVGVLYQTMCMSN